MRSRDLTWIAGAGGPLLLLPADIAHHWRGIEPPPGATLPEGWSWGDPGGPLCDYDRIVAADRDLLEMIDVGPGSGLILGDEPMMTAFLPSTGGGIFARWGFAEEGTDVARVVATAPASAWEATPHRLRVGAGGLVLLDSALRGDHPPPRWRADAPSDWLEIACEPGEYRVDCADHRPDARTRLILIRLSRSTRAGSAPGV